MSTLHDIELFVDEHQGICDSGRPATNELIEKAEEFLDLCFPEDYRAFLRKWGTLAIGPLEFYGICKSDFENSSVPDAIWYTQRLRSQLGLPKELIVLYDNNGVELYCIDTTKTDKSEIVAWDIHLRGIRAVKSDSLFDFILSESADLVE